MEKIINGKRYSTDTAKNVGYWCSNITDDLYRVEEILYRKKTGEFWSHSSPPSRKKESKGSIRPI